VIFVRLILRLTLSLTVLWAVVLATTLAAAQSFEPSAALAYVTNLEHIMLLETDHGNNFDLTGSNFQWVASPAWSPDGRYLAFVAWGDDKIGYDLNVLDMASHQFRRLVSHIEMSSTPPEPSWSPDGRRVALYGAENNIDGIFIVDVETSAVEHLSHVRGTPYPEWPAWSPRGDQIAFVANDASGLERDLWLIDADGENVRRVGEVQTTISRAAWSPDGRWLAYPSADGITVANLQDDGLTYQIPALYITMQPAWSPDGQYLYYGELNEGGSLAVSRFDTATHTATKLLSNPSPGTELEVSPDGRQIALAILCIPDLCIHVMKVDGSHHRVVAAIPQPQINFTGLAWWP
jgi:Tol biopolymer transport system component